MKLIVSFCLFATAASVAGAQSPPIASRPVDTGYVIYDDSPISLPLGIGFRLPAYTRVDGLVLPWGPRLELGDGKLEANAIVAYRSHLGTLDPRFDVSLRARSNLWLEVEGERGTFSNDKWIRGDLVNSAASFFTGSDARNYFRADRYTARARLEIARGAMFFEPAVGLLTERARSLGSPVPPRSHPWSVFGRTSEQGMRRPNPAIEKGRITSALAVLGFNYAREKLSFDGSSLLETAVEAPRGASFSQISTTLRGRFPALANHEFAFRARGLTTLGDTAPPQRHGYLGGAGTLNTLDLLEIGGDRLLFVEGIYSVPIGRVELPFVGSPVVGLRYAAGSAGIGRLPNFIQNVGVRVGVKFATLEYTYDPARRESAFSAGVSLSQ